MDPRNDILNNAINEDGVVIVDVRSPGKSRLERTAGDHHSTFF